MRFFNIFNSGCGQNVNITVPELLAPRSVYNKEDEPLICLPNGN